MEFFFCIHCNRLVEIGKAAKLFRTGYYRVEYRLGCCASCSPAILIRAKDAVLSPSCS